MSQDRMQDNSSRQISIDQEQTTSNPPVESKIPQKPSGKIRVSHGANEQYFDGLTGKTVGKIRKSLKEVFNIPSDAAALVDGKEVDAEFILQPNQHLEFYKESGTKGRIGIIPYFLVVVHSCFSEWNFSGFLDSSFLLER